MLTIALVALTYTVHKAIKAVVIDARNQFGSVFLIACFSLSFIVQSMFLVSTFEEDYSECETVLVEIRRYLMCFPLTTCLPIATTLWMQLKSMRK